MTADPGVVCAGVVAVGAGLPTPPVRTGHAAGRLAAGYLGVLRAAARRTTGHPVGGSCATDAKHRRFTDPVFEQNPYSFAVRAAAIDVAVGIQDHPTSRRTIAARASHFRSHRRHRQRAQPESQPLDQRRALPADPELWLEAAALNNETWWQDWTRCVADRRGPMMRALDRCKVAKRYCSSSSFRKRHNSRRCDRRALPVGRKYRCVLR